MQTTSAIVYQFPSTILALPILATVVLVGAAVFLWKKGVPRRIPLVLMLLGGFFGVLMAPAMWMDRVILDEEKLEQNTGFWWEQTAKGFRIADADSVQIVTRRDMKNHPMKPGW